MTAWIARNRALLAALVLTALLVSGCGDSYNDSRGRGDAPVGRTDDTPAEVLNFPDGYKNIATKCDGHGHRVYATSAREGNMPQLFVLADPSCPGGQG